MKKTLLLFLCVCVNTLTQAQWQQLPDTMTGGAPVNAMAAHNSQVLVGTSNSIVLSANGGDFWEVWNAGLPSSISITSVAIIGNLTFLAGTSDGKIFKLTLPGVGSWRLVDQSSTDPVTSFFVRGNTIWAKHCCGSCTTYESNDSGETWHELNMPWGCFKNFVQSNNNIYHGDWTGPVVSVGGIGPWTTANNGWSGTSDYSLIAADDQNHLVCTRGYWGMADASWTYYATASSNPTWQACSGFSLHNGNAAAIRDFLGCEGYIFAAINNSETDTDNGVFVTSDGGATWVVDKPGVGFNSLALDRINGALFAGGKDGSIWRKTIALNRPTVATQVMQLYPNPASQTLQLQLPTHAVPNRVHITDISGKTILVQHQTDTLIDVANLAPGVYFIEVESDRQRWVAKFIKQ